MQSRVYAAVVHLSVPPPQAAAAGLLLWARQQRDIDRLLHGRLTNAVSASPTAKGRA